MEGGGSRAERAVENDERKVRIWEGWEKYGSDGSKEVAGRRQEAWRSIDRAGGRAEK